MKPAQPLLVYRARLPMLKILSHPAFWDRKLRIAILTIATFAALC
jgi:hypothetical protein